MQLTAREFAILIRDLRCDMRPQERRSNPRAPTRTRVEVIPIIPGKPPVSELLRVRDISRTGMGVLSNQKPDDGRRMLVLLTKSETESFVLLCEVARITRLPGDAYGVGLRMVRRVSEDERVAFMKQDATTIAALLTPSVATPAVPPAAAA